VSGSRAVDEAPPVIRLNYEEPFAGTDSANPREYPISQIELWQQPGLVAGIALTLLAISSGRRLLISLRRSIRRWFVRWFWYQVSVTALTRE